MSVKAGEWPKVFRDVLLAVLTASIIGAGTGMWSAKDTLTRMDLLVGQHSVQLAGHETRLRDVERATDRNTYRGPTSYYGDPRDEED